MARPKEFDRDEALERAMQTFWDHGYEATSTALLEERMGIRRSSLYATFGSKDQLYAEAMDAYSRNLRERVIARLEAGGPALEVLEGFFRGVADRGQPGAEPRRCCMIVRACVSGSHPSPEIRDRIEASVGELDDAFHGLLERARDEGALPGNGDLRDSARFLTTTFQALNVAAHAGRSQRELHQMVERALSTLT